MRQSWSTLHFVQALLIAIVLLFTSTLLNAQIVIKEQILIDPSNPQNHFVHMSPKDSPPNLFLVAPRLGLMQLEVQWGSKLYNPIPPAAYIRVTLPETTYTATVNPFFNYFISFWVTNYDTCGGTRVPDGYMKYSGYRETTYPIELLFIRVPKTGDTLRFVFHDTVDIPATSISGDSANGWSISNTIPPQNVNCWTAPDNLELSESALSYADTDFAGFRIITSADTIGYGGVDTIRAIAISSKGKEINLSGGSLVKYSASPSKYGGFKKTTGDTVISPVQYSDARNGKIYYVSDVTTISDTIRSITARVSYVTDTTKNGTGQFTIKRNLQWQKWSQGDSRWGDSTFGSYMEVMHRKGQPDTLVWYKFRRKGCTVTGSAIILNAFGVDVDPGRLNTYLREYDGYDENNNLDWELVADYDSSKVAWGGQIGSGIDPTNVQSSPTVPIDSLGQYVNNDSWGIEVEVWDSKNKSPHWVVVTSFTNGKYNIIDPGFSSFTNLTDSYSNTIYKRALFRRK